MVPFFLYLAKNKIPWKKGLHQFLNIPIIYHHAKSQKKLMKENARTFSKTSTPQENRISRLKKALNLYNKENFKPDLSNTLDKTLTAISLDFLKAFDWVD